MSKPTRYFPEDRERIVRKVQVHHGRSTQSIKVRQPMADVVSWVD